LIVYRPCSVNICDNRHRICGKELPSKSVAGLCYYCHWERCIFSSAASCLLSNRIGVRPKRCCRSRRKSDNITRNWYKIRNRSDQTDRSSSKDLTPRPPIPIDFQLVSDRPCLFHNCVNGGRIQWRMRLPVFCGAEGWSHVEFITRGMGGLAKDCCVGLDHVKSL